MVYTQEGLAAIEHIMFDPGDRRISRGHSPPGPEPAGVKKAARHLLHL